MQAVLLSTAVTCATQTGADESVLGRRVCSELEAVHLVV
jgi:hypothetical protein